MLQHLSTIVVSHQRIQWVIGLVALLVFGNTITHKWTVDDAIVVHQNRFVKRGVAGLDSILTKETFYGFFGKETSNVAGGRWRPLTLMVFALEAEVFGTVEKNENEEVLRDASGFKVKNLGADTLFPHIAHIFNVLAYALLCMLLYRLVLHLLNPSLDANNGRAYFTACSAALLFAVHPLHTEVVANVKGLDEILSLLFALLSTYALLKAFDAKQHGHAGVRNYVLFASVAFFLSLLAKESTVPFLLVAPMTLWFFRASTLKQVALWSLPLLVPFVLFMGARSMVVGKQSLAKFETNELMNDPFLVLNPAVKFVPLAEGMKIQKIANPKVDAYHKMPYANQLAVVTYSAGRYLTLLLLPYPLTSDYYPKHIAPKSFEQSIVFASLLVHLLLLGWALSRLKERNPLSYCILFYLSTFSIVSNLFFPIGTNMAERFMFVPSVGACLGMAMLVSTIVGKLSERAGAFATASGMGIVVAVSFVFAVLAFQRNLDWKDNLTLFGKDVQTSSNSAKINADYAGQLMAKAEAEEREGLKTLEGLPAMVQTAAGNTLRQVRIEQIKMAEPYIAKALELHPCYVNAWLELANVYQTYGGFSLNTAAQRIKYYEVAAKAYEQARLFKPNDKNIGKLLALLYCELARLHGETLGDVQTSIHYLEQAVACNGQESEVYFLLATAYSKIKDYEKSIKYSERCVKMRPQDDGAKENLARAYLLKATEKEDFSGLARAEELVLEVIKSYEKLPPVTEPARSSMLVGAYDLLQRIYGAQGNEAKQREYKSLILQKFPNYFQTQTSK